MKFLQIYRFELRYQLRHGYTWILSAIFLLFGFSIFRMVTLEDGVFLNAPSTIAFFTVFASVIWVVIGGVVAGEAATRDMQCRINPLTHALPVSKFAYLGGRILGALTLNALLFLVLYIGILLSFYAPGARTHLLGSFRLSAYLTNYVFLTLPLVLATTSIQFAVALSTRRVLAAYIAAILLVGFSQFGGTTVRYLLEWKFVGVLMDLLGTSAIMEMEGWTPLEKNTRLLLPEGTWLWNRIAWVCLSVVALALTYFRFRFGIDTGTSSKDIRLKQQPDETSVRSHGHIARSITQPVFGPRAALTQLLEIARTSFVAIATSRAGLTLVGILAIGTGLFATEYMQWYGVPFVARTEEVLRIFAPPLDSIRTHWIIIPLLIIFYSGELVWRERDANINALTDPSPLPEWILFIGKFLGLACIISAWTALLMIGGMTNQLVMGYYQFELDVYIKALFGIQLINYLLFGLVVFSIHVLVNQKYVGHIVGTCLYGYMIFSGMLGVEHKMVVFAADPGWSFSDMRGFGSSIVPWMWFKLYWFAVALLVAIVSMLFWVRSRETALQMRLLLARRRFPEYRSITFILLAVFFLTAAFIFYNTNILNPYETRASQKKMRAEYEIRYGKYVATLQPQLVHTSLWVDLYPTEGKADVDGTYYLKNDGHNAVDSIHISTVPHMEFSKFMFDRVADEVLVDENVGYRIYSLRERLRPGDSVRLQFAFTVENKGFTNDGVDQSVIKNGTHLTDSWMPVIGYDDDRRLRDSRDREEAGLPPRPRRASLYDSAARYDLRESRKIQFDAVVGTTKDQIAVAPGTLEKTWTEGARRYFQYKTNAPILNEYAFFSARYAVAETLWRKKGDSVKVEIYHHPTHSQSIESMMRSAVASLEFYSEKFGRYPYEVFRVLERPGPGRGMHAEPMTIDYEGGYSLMNPEENDLDLPYHIMSHEVAHQWWGLGMTPAPMEGSGFLVESFATYSAMQVVEETLGYDHLLKYLEQMKLEYEVPRSRAAPPLLQANDRFMMYRRGPFALFCLRQYIGKDSVTSAMSRLIRKYGQTVPSATTLDFYDELKRVTPDTLRYLIHDLFAMNTLWDLKTKSANAEKMPSGQWRVVLEVEAHKVTVDSTGHETDVPMKDWIEIGVFGQKKAAQPSRPVLYSEKHRLVSGRHRIVIVVPEKPFLAGIDPHHLLIDFEGDDNRMKVHIDTETDDDPEAEFL